MQSIEKQNRTTEAMYAQIWLDNAVRNLPLIVTSPEIGLFKDKFAGETAIVVAAGPGLNELLPWIKAVADQYVIIAVGTSLRSLIKAGIEPDFVVAVDSSEEIIPQFAGVPTSRTLLVGAHTLQPEVFSFFPGRTILFTADVLPGFNFWLENLGILPERLRIGGTVSLSAIDFAVHLGCNRLILTGLDLAFAEDGSTHAVGTVYEKARITSGSWLSIPGNHGKTVRSSRQFISYIKMIENYLTGQTGLKVYNLNSGGAKIDGTMAVLPGKQQETELSAVKNEKYEYIFSFIGSTRKKIPETELDLQLLQLQQELRQIAELTGIAITALEEYDEQKNDQPPPQLLALLDMVDARLKERTIAARILEGIIKVAYSGIYGISMDINTLLRQNKEIYRCLHDQAVTTADELGLVSARIQRQQGEKNG